MKSKAFDVFLNDKWLDTVFYDADMTADDVRVSLVNHDRYHPNIVVVASTCNCVRCQKGGL